MDTETLLKKRDAQAIPHLEQYAPVWLFDEKLMPEDDSVLFSVVFQHPFYGWVQRRYRYDGFGDVLYYLGEIAIPEAEALTIQSQAEPYINPLVADFVDAYGG